MLYTFIMSPLLSFVVKSFGSSGRSLLRHRSNGILARVRVRLSWREKQRERRMVCPGCRVLSGERKRRSMKGTASGYCSWYTCCTSNMCSHAREHVQFDCDIWKGQLFVHPFVCQQLLLDNISRVRTCPNCRSIIGDRRLR